MPFSFKMLLIERLFSKWRFELVLIITKYALPKSYTHNNINFFTRYICPRGDCLGGRCPDIIYSLLHCQPAYITTSLVDVVRSYIIFMPFHILTLFPQPQGRLKIMSHACLFSVFSSALTQIMEVMTGPMMQSLESRLEHNLEKIENLEQEKQHLLKQIEEQNSMV